VEKYDKTGQVTDNNTVHAHCMLDNEGYKTHSEYAIIFVFPLQQWLQERASLLRYTHIACLLTDVLC